MRSRGFTLIELVVVLMILALVTHLAVRELGKVQRDRMQQLASQQLQTVQDAVWQFTPGTEPTGFLVDMGRLPMTVQTTNRWGRTVLTLSELWRSPSGSRNFAIRQAVSSNLVVSASEASELANESVRIPCGWRGPYLRMPLGRDELTDPWGNPMETPDDAGYARLLRMDGSTPSPNEAVARIRHLGADGRPDGQVTPADAAARDAEIELIPGVVEGNSLVVNVSWLGSSGVVAVDGNVRCRWYMPCGDAITGGVSRVVNAGTSQTSFVFEGLPPGICTLAIDVAGTQCALERVVVPPGGKVLGLKVLVRE